MASVMIACPETGEEIYTGIEIDQASFEKLPEIPSSLRCSACGACHFWTKRQAWLSTHRVKQLA
jgi:hypothetical protein